MFILSEMVKNWAEDIDANQSTKGNEDCWKKK